MNRAARSSKSMGARRIFVLETQNRQIKISKGQKLISRFFLKIFGRALRVFRRLFDRKFYSKKSLKPAKNKQKSLAKAGPVC